MQVLAHMSCFDHDNLRKSWDIVPDFKSLIQLLFILYDPEFGFRMFDDVLALLR